MKFAIIYGSPRKRDGYNIGKKFEKMINEKENIEFDHIHIVDMDMQNCLGCKQCFNMGENYCPCKDEVQSVKKRIVDADGIIFISPVYAVGVTGIMKCFIDRLSYLFHRPELIGKPVLSIVTTDGGGQSQTQSYLKMIAAGWGGKLIGQVSVVSPKYFANSKYHDFKYAIKIDKMLEKYGVDMIAYLHDDKLKHISMYDKLLFHGLKSKTLTSQVDREYWESKGWLDGYYFYKTKERKSLRILGKLMDIIIDFLYKRLYKESK